MEERSRDVISLLEELTEQCRAQGRTDQKSAKPDGGSFKEYGGTL